ncbi:MAG: Fur-regulated basic protein FbpA [Bacillus sp. (in: firmicutes)]
MELAKLYENRKNVVINSLIDRGIYKIGDFGHLYEAPLQELEKKYEQVITNDEE